MKILIACEFSGVVRDAFRLLGHNAWSCDLLPSEVNIAHFHAHYQMDALEVIKAEHWDMMIAFPPCTHLASSGARWFGSKRQEQINAIAFVRSLMNAPITSIAIENPVGVLSSYIRKPDQYIQPWQFGHGETKKTCLWLKGLPRLRPTKIVEGRVARDAREPPSPDRWKARSRTLQGIADAMADQWGNL